MGTFLNNRFTKPWEAPSYVLYFFVVIVLVGTFGVLKDILQMHFCLCCTFDDEKVKSFSFNTSSTGLALITASVIELILISRKSIEKEVESFNLKYEELENLKKGIRIFGLSSLIISFILWILINNIIEGNWVKIILSIILLLFSYFIWWISNVQNKVLSFYVNNSISAIGGTVKDQKDMITDDDQNNEKKESQENNLNGDLTSFNTGK